MHITPSTKPFCLQDKEIQALHTAVMHILRETGVRIENEEICRRLTTLGAKLAPDHNAARRVTFSTPAVDAFIAASDPFDWTAVKPHMSCAARAYSPHFLNPETNMIETFSEESLATYFRLAQELPEVDGWGTLGCPAAGFPRPTLPLAERYINWKYGGRAGGSVWDIRLAPYLVEMAEVMSAETGEGVQSHHVAGFYLQSPLQLGRVEAEQALWFTDRGLPVSFGHMVSQGGSGPVTVAGSVAMKSGTRESGRTRCWRPGCKATAGRLSTMLATRGTMPRQPVPSSRKSPRTRTGNCAASCNRLKICFQRVDLGLAAVDFTAVEATIAEVAVENDQGRNT